jgi:hypothetical protein
MRSCSGSDEPVAPPPPPVAGAAFSPAVPLATAGEPARASGAGDPATDERGVVSRSALVKRPRRKLRSRAGVAVVAVAGAAAGSSSAAVARALAMCCDAYCRAMTCAAEVGSFGELSYRSYDRSSSERRPSSLPSKSNIFGWKYACLVSGIVTWIVLPLEQA